MCRTVTYGVDSSSIADFIKATILFVTASRLEAGCVRFDIMQVFHIRYESSCAPRIFYGLVTLSYIILRT